MHAAPVFELEVAEVYAALDSTPTGLLPAEAAARCQLYGRNELRAASAPPLWRRLLLQLRHPMTVLLLAAGLVALVGGKPGMAAIVWAVVVINEAFAFWQGYRAERAIDSLRQLLPAFARVERGGEQQQISARDLCPGDVIVLAEGDNIPADARVVEEFGLRVNNSTLTGEAVPARKTAAASRRAGLTEIERPNLIFAGTSVVSGTARAVVFSIGALTQFGRIASLTHAVVSETSALQKQIERITRRSTLAACALAVVVFAVSEGQLAMEGLDAFLLTVGLLVATVPVGLTPIVTLTLAMAAQRLIKRGVLVKQLSVLETLGSVSVICTDKSGTLTQNQMTVRTLWVGGQRLEVTGVGYAPEGAIVPAPTEPGQCADLERLLCAGTLCNNARLNAPTADKPLWHCLGDQTEAALLALALKGGLAAADMYTQFPRLHELPFDARRKRMSTIHQCPDGELAFVKGAPREVLQLCDSVLLGGRAQALTDEMRAEILAANEDYAANTLRVLGLAQRQLSGRGGYTEAGVEQQLTFLGLAGMMDPARPEVAAAVATCRTAGIRIVMITGDYGLTAATLAMRVGILTRTDARIITGAEVEQLSDGELQAALAGEVLFARMAPEHKLRMVAAFQARGDVVVVSGDGVNDAPALRKADIGVAMGITGTDVAIQAADIVLTDDNFGSIVASIEEGRAVYANLRSFITYILASNVPEVLPFLATALFGIPLALTVPQILAIDLGTDVLPALALGNERPDRGAMQHAPRPRNEPLIDRKLLLRAFGWLGMIEAALCFAGFGAVYWLAGALPVPAGLQRPDWLPAISASGAALYLLATTVFHVGVVAAQVGNAFACRTETERLTRRFWFTNGWLLLGVAVEIVFIGLLVYVPALARLFDHAPVPLWLLPLFAAFPAILYGLEWLRKLSVRTRAARSAAA